MVDYDLTGVSEQQYRTRLRPARWAAAALAFVITLGIARVFLAVNGSNSLVILGFGSTALALLVFLVVYVTAPRPTRLNIEQGSLSFAFRSGRVLRLATGAPRFAANLIESTRPSPALRTVSTSECPYFVSVELRWFPLTLEAYTAMGAEFKRAGLSMTLRNRGTSPLGGWRYYQFRRAPNRSA